MTHSHYSNAADRFINARVRLWRPFVANLFAEHLAAIAEVVEATADEDLDACFALAKEPKPAARSGGKGGGEPPRRDRGMKRDLSGGFS